MKKLLLTLFLIACTLPSLNAQVLKLKKNGFLSTYRYFTYRQKHTDVQSEIKKLNVTELKTTLGGREVSFRIAHSKLDPKKPTVIAHIGLNGQIDDPNVIYLYKTAKKYLDEVNFVIIDTLSSGYMMKNTCTVTLGGIEDIKLVEESVRHLITMTALSEAIKPELILMGGSGSSFTLFHAANFLTNKFENTIAVKGIFILSGYDNYYKYIDYLESVDKLVYETDKDILKDEKQKFKLKSRIIGKLGIKNRIKNYNQELVPACENFSLSTKYNPVSYVSLLEKSFDAVKKDVERIYRDTYPHKGKIIFESLKDYHDKIKISDHLDELSIPVLFFHAKNDPLSSYREIDNSLFSKLGEYQNINAVVSPYGGHGSFAWVYGEDWLFKQVKEFLKTL